MPPCSLRKRWESWGLARSFSTPSTLLSCFCFALSLACCSPLGRLCLLAVPAPNPSLRISSPRARAVLCCSAPCRGRPVASSCPSPPGAEERGVGETPGAGEGCAGRCPPRRRLDVEGGGAGRSWGSQREGRTSSVPGLLAAAKREHEGQSDREMVELRVLRAGRRVKGKLASLGFRRADLGPPQGSAWKKHPVGQDPGGHRDPGKLANAQGSPPKSSGGPSHQRGGQAGTPGGLRG